ncbi:MAG: hypothetical protein GXP62_04800, partial [Oligoflexia bacterium]|nr:hypothetical protein [Oligoflexia bacterium]
ALSTVLKTLGYPDAASLLADLADLDTNDDGVADAISTAFTFSALPCGLQP